MTSQITLRVAAPSRLRVRDGRPGVVEDVVFLGSNWKFVVRLADGSEVIVSEPTRSDTEGIARVGQAVRLSWSARDAWVTEPDR